MGSDIAIWMVGLLIVLIISGFHIAIALSACSVVGIYLMVGSVDAALSILESSAYEAIRKDVFAVIPLFVLMGDFVSRSGAAGDLYRACNRLLHFLPGRLAIATIAGNVVFGAVTGVSIAAAATFSRIAYPEMQKLGYGKSFSLGAIAGSASLGMLIPPSVLMIVWSILTEMSVGALFMAGIVPGILLACTFALYVVVAAYRNPKLAPEGTQTRVMRELAPPSLNEQIGVFGILGIIVLVIGGMWLGFFTPTEAAGFGTLFALGLALLKGLRGKEIMEAIIQSGRTTAPIMILLIAAQMYSRLLAFGGVVNAVQAAMLNSGLGTLGIIALMTIIWLILGALIDSVSIILLTVPIFAPIAIALGFDPLGFAIFGILIIEAGLLTPPFGLLVFTVKGCVDDPTVTLRQIFTGSTPYTLSICFVGFVVLAIPSLASWLPKLMFGQ